MDKDRKELSRLYINQYFTKEEIELLRDYLLRHNDTDLFVLEHSLPIQTTFIKPNGEKTYYSSFHEVEYSDNTLCLYNAEDYDLHFRVAGHFNPEGGDPTTKLPWYTISDGVSFLQKALKSMNCATNCSDLELEKILNKIYEQEGYYVNNITYR